MMLADDVVLCCEEKAGLEEDLERWRNALEKRGMKVLRAKTEYMCLSGVSRGSVQMQYQHLPEMNEFKYLGSTPQTDGGVEAEINRRIQSGWNNWKMSRVMCDRRILAKVKGKVHQTVIQPAFAIWTRDAAPDKEDNKETRGGRNENVQMGVWQDQKRQRVK